MDSNIDRYLVNLENAARDDVKSLRMKIRQEEYKIKCYEETKKKHDLEWREMEKVVESMDEKREQQNAMYIQMKDSCDSLRKSNAVLEERIRLEENVARELDEKRLLQRERLDKDICRHETLLKSYQEIYDALPGKRKPAESLLQMAAAISDRKAKQSNPASNKLDAKDEETVQEIVIEIAEMWQETRRIHDKIREKLRKNVEKEISEREARDKNVDIVPELMDVSCVEPTTFGIENVNLEDNMSQVADEVREFGEENVDVEENTTVTVASSDSGATPSFAEIGNVTQTSTESPGFPFATRSMFALPVQESVDVVSKDGGKTDKKKVAFLLWASQDQTKTSSVESSAGFTLTKGDASMDCSQYATVTGPVFEFGNSDRSETGAEFANLLGANFASPDSDGGFPIRLF